MSGQAVRVEGDWRPWFAWRPVFTKGGELVWLKRIRRRSVAYSAFGIAYGRAVATSFTDTEYAR